MSKVHEKMSTLHDRIQKCHLCPAMCREKERRNESAFRVKETDVVVISQALAEGGLRVSGVGFFEPTGKLTPTGRNLEKFLNLIDRTVFPSRPTTLKSGSIIAANHKYHSVYTSEIVHCFPGKARKSDRVPSKSEINTCVEQGFLLQELNIIEPRLIMLMGDVSRRTFYEHFLGQKRSDSLAEHIEKTCKTGTFDYWKNGALSIPVFPIQHASGANPGFHAMLENKPLISLIKQILKTP